MPSEKIPKGYELGQLENFTPEQKQLRNQAFGYLGSNSYLARLAGGDFGDVEGNAWKNYEQSQGMLGSRFGMQNPSFGGGSLGERYGTQALTDYGDQLRSQRSALQMKAIEDLMSHSNMLLGQKPFEKFLVPEQKENNPWGPAFSGMFQGAGTGSSLGPWGTILGGMAGGASGYFSTPNRM